MRLRRVAVRVLLGPSLSILVAAGASGETLAPETQQGFCSRPFSAKSAFRSEAGTDLYNGLLWMGGAAAVQFGANEKTRWSRTNSFDDDVRSGLRGGSPSARNDADTASDVMLGMTIGLMPLVAIGKTLSERDCHQAYDMATDAIESITLTLFLTEAFKTIAGRERPFVQECDGSPPRDASCGDSNRKRSFFSGHASLAAAGAGLSCSYAIQRKTWGESRTAQAVPCAFGVGAAVTTGVLRIVADKHWGTDVIVGLAVGGTVGYFDTWGPFDLLRFEVESDDRRWDLRGVVLPYAGDGEIGMRLGVSF